MNKNPHQDTNWRRYAATFISAARERDYSQDDIDICLSYAKPLINAGLPVIFGTDHFCKLVGYSPSYIFGAINNTPTYYRYFEIAKRSGGKRKIAEPLPSLKEIQVWILRNILDKIAVHPAAKAFVKGRSIRENARFHRGQQYVLTIDVKDFFGQIKANRVFSVYKNMGYSKQVSSLLTDISCLNAQLPQGAPTSPALSNIVCRGMDDRILSYSRMLSLRYTRYADDLTFSGQEIDSGFISSIYNILEEHAFSPNLKKTRLMREYQRQQVTGAIVNKKIQASRELRRDLRQQAYFIRKFGLEAHASALSITKGNFRAHLLGKAGFVRSLNARDRDAAALIAALEED